ncbi:bifunctional GNAT family N-acetyltransferase/acetate--CoA ligase family protein [Blastococcus sp. VKM Ac-2987]|uniref:bifunctional GNAT family N-acetyltransferase/acetate--CoA ligase family protein n=1 Tax=Blastococcus sp. VKM Ac-2987 TaxID=3004141 RepID=UPI0022AB52AE|nr:bifunctional GNAT family N-acetyltransferase/acetate--CoA ligase family protein [Blastococcus sp. VKM Ac-2987]MCZ2860587.1 GNAT family N-acetyltransferase [Blastococcus sp. VKM Ac-2987]
MPTRPVRVLLRSGVPALIAPLGPADAGELLDLHESLSDRDRYLRFATVHPGDLPAYIAQSLAPAHGGSTLGARVRGRLVGAVQLLPVGGDLAEVAAVVDAHDRHEGVATVLLEELAAVAQRMGVHRFQAYVLAENGPMVRVLTDLGMPLELRRNGADLSLEVVLEPGDRYRAASEDRYRRATAASLEPVFRPAGIAVVGAGRGEASVGRAVLRGLRAAGFSGAVHAVNPAADELEGFPCRRSVRDVPGPVDLAVLAVPAAGIAAAVEECGEAGVRGLVVLSGGFPAVPGLAGRVRDLVDRYGMRMVGPNSVGVAAPGEPAHLDATFAGRTPPAGDVGLVAQSGGVVIAAAAGWQRMGLGLSTMAAIGDAHDVGARDLLARFDEDPGTRIAVLYAENEPDLRGLARTAAHLARRMPVLALASGTSAAGARAAASHTARAATPYAVREAAYAGAGIQSVPDLTTLTAAVALLRGQPLPRAGTVAVLTNIGGGGVLTADACVAEGLPVEPLPGDLRDRLSAVLPSLAATGNPVDAGAAVSADAFAAALRCLLADPRVGAVVTVTAPTGVSHPAEGVAAAVAAAGSPVPVVDVRLAGDGILHRLPVRGGPEDRFLLSVTEPALAARALAVAWRRASWLTRPEDGPVPPPDVDVVAARAVLAGVLARSADGGWLLPHEAVALCTAAGIPAVPTRWAGTPAVAAAAAVELAGPVAVKGVVRGVVHKGDAGLLRLPVTDPEEVAGVVAEWRHRARGDWLGAVVQPLAPAGDEILVGAVRDAAAGAVVVLGPGGRATDALGHRVHRLAPVADADVAEMLAGTGLFATAHGRTLAAGAVADCLRRVAWLADALPEIAELDVNPLVVTPTGARALDVRARICPLPG